MTKSIAGDNTIFVIFLLTLQFKKFMRKCGKIKMPLPNQPFPFFSLCKPKGNSCPNILTGFILYYCSTCHAP
jgi:hypothetical protein